MYFNSKFKYFLWGFLLILSLVFFSFRIDSILKGNLTSIETYVLVIFTFLVLMPFFSEISFFGFKIKQQLSEVKNDIIKEINNLKIKINNISEMNNNMDSHIYLGNEPTDKLIEKWEESAKKMFKNLNGENKKEKVNVEIYDISKDVITLFSARYKIETELRRIWLNNFEGHIDDRNALFIKSMLNDLHINEIITRKMVSLIHRVYRITTPGIHGEDVTSKQVEYVKMIMPEIIKQLENIS